MKTDKQKLQDVIKVCKNQIQLRDNSTKRDEFDHGVVYLAGVILREIDETNV